MTTYIALIHKDADSDYGVSFPDLPGCVSAGSTMDEAIANAKEALSLHIEGMLEDGDEVPPPTDAYTINREDALLIAAIDVPDNLKVERINITVPAITLARIDSFAQQRGMTRSALLVEAVQRWIAEEHAALNRPERPRLVAATQAAPVQWNQIQSAQETVPTEAALSAIQEALSIQDGKEQLKGWSKTYTNEIVSLKIDDLVQQIIKRLRVEVNKQISTEREEDRQKLRNEPRKKESVKLKK
jgi:predicted RNase H-like HicB family nuclease